MTTLSRDDYRRRVHGCWVGKNVGGTLGAPHEGNMSVLDLTYYDPVPTGAIPNDDLELQLVWLAALREHGPATDERTLTDAWRRWLRYPWDEYGMALWNVNRGLVAPVSGQFANHFGDCMGAPIRSEIWACIAPGCPDLAAEYAYCDGCVDHSREGIWGEVFFASLQSAAFVEPDRDRLLDIGLAMIPVDSRVAQAVRLTRRLHADGLDWRAAREGILAECGHHNFTDAPQNIAFTVLGWLWGENASDAMCKAVNCGYDTDCTGATLGAILGLLHGPEVFEQRWIDPVGDDVVCGWGVVDCETPKTIAELTEWTLEVADAVIAYHHAPIKFGAKAAAGQLKAERTPSLSARLAHHDWTLRFPARIGEEAVTAWVDLAGPPALAPDEERVIRVTLDPPIGKLSVDRLGPGWTARDLGEGQFAIKAPARIQEAAWHTMSMVLRPGRSAVCDIGWVPASGWQVSGPHVVDSAADELYRLVEADDWRAVWTPDHRLKLDDGADHDRVYRIRTHLNVPDAREARLVAATGELQRVMLDGAEAFIKTEPTAFIPAAHRSGPGTTTVAARWSAGDHLLDILLAARAGQPAEVHVYLTRSREDEARMVPWEDVVLRMP